MDAWVLLVGTLLERLVGAKPRGFPIKRRHNLTSYTWISYSPRCSSDAVEVISSGDGNTGDGEGY
jgi:hypothetical protein